MLRLRVSKFVIVTDRSNGFGFRFYAVGLINNFRLIIFMSSKKATKTMSNY